MANADSEGEEGKFYVWSLAEVEQALGAKNAAFFAARYDVSAVRNFEGHNILNQLNALTDTSTFHAAANAAAKAQHKGAAWARRQNPR